MKVFPRLFKLLLICALLLPVKIFGQTDYKVQSMFIYNFTTLVNWPSDYQSGEFVLAVFGSSPMYEEFQDMARKRSVSGRPIVARQFTRVTEISKCHIIYVPARYSRSLSDIANHLKRRNINALVVTNARGSIRNGAVINFTVRQERQRFQISQQNAENMGLTLGGDIVRLGISMD